MAQNKVVVQQPAGNKILVSEINRTISLAEDRVQIVSIAEQGPPGSSPNNYIATVSLNGGNLDFGGYGAAFNSSVDLSPLYLGVNTVYETVKNAHTAPLVKGTPLAVVPGQTGGNISDVVPADASNASLMPAMYILNEDLDVEQEGLAITHGLIRGIDTSAFTSGTTVYVAPGGGWTTTKPVYPNLIQNLGIITKSHASNGGGVVMGAGRSNDLPNLTAGKLWVGTSTYPAESTTVHIDESNTRFGIGTNTPTQTLDVSGNVRITGALYDSNNSSGISGQVLSSTGTGLDWVDLTEISGVDGTGTANYVAKWSDSDSITDSSIYDNGTNVGIGTSNPNEKLVVHGNLWLQDVDPIIYGYNKSTSIDLYNGSAGIDLNTPSSSKPINLNGRIVVSGTSSFNDNLILSGSNRYIVSGGNRLTVYSGNADMSFKIGHPTVGDFLWYDKDDNTMMKLTRGGNLGIGTTNPSWKLHVNSTQRAAIFGYNTPWTSDGVVYIGAYYATHKPLLVQHHSALANSSSYFFAQFRNGDDEDVIKLRTDGSADFNGSLKVNSTNNLGRITVNPTNDSNDAIGIDERGFIAFADAGTLNTRFRGLPGGGFQFQDDAYNTFFNLSKGGNSYLNTTGNFGIGTTSPTEKLHIQGTFSNNTFKVRPNSDHTIVSSDQEFRISTTNSADIFIAPNGLKKAVFKATGSVGIGTSTPTYTLESVANSSGQNLRLRSNSNNGGANIAFSNNDVSEYWGGIGAGYITPGTSIATKIGFSATNYLGYTSTIATMTTTGLGIATSDVTHRFVVKNIYNNTSSIVQKNSTDSINFAVGNVGTNQDGTLSLFNGGGTGTISLNSNGNSYINGGNVGIGTTSPQQKLHVEGTIRIGSDVDLSRYGGRLYTAQDIVLGALNAETANITVNASNKSVLGVRRPSSGTVSVLKVRDYSTQDVYVDIDSDGNAYFDGNVGIGTASPAQVLHINKTNPYIQIQDSSAPTRGDMSAGILMKDSTGAQSFSLAQYNSVDVLMRAHAGDLSFGTFAGTVLKIDGNNVGIGTTSPSHKLHVVNGSNTLLVTRDVGTAVRIGIGNPNPSYAIELGTYSDNAIGGIKYLRFYNGTDRLDVTGNGRFGFKASRGYFFYPTTDTPSGDIYGVAIRHLRDSATYTNDDVLLVEKSDGTDLFSVKSSGNVTIAGAATFDSDLTVQGNLTVNGTTTTLNTTELTIEDKNIVLANGAVDAAAADGAGITIDGADATLTYNSTNDRLDFNKKLKVTGGVLIDSTGVLGYAIQDTVNGRFGEMRITGDSSRYFEIRGYQNATILRQGGFGNVFLEGGNTISFVTGASERIRIDSSGNVGIGTTSPAQKLDVNGYIASARLVGRSTTGLIAGSHVASSYALGVQYNSNQSATSGDKSILNAFGNWNPSSGLANFNGITVSPTLNQTGTALGGARGFYYNPTVTSVLGTHRAIETTAGDVIFNGGNVGVGTTSPTVPLHVNGDVLVNNEIRFVDNAVRIYRSGDVLRFRVDNSDRVTINTSGNVGIGTTAPSELLHLSSTTPLVRFDDTNSGLHYIVGQDGDQFKFTTNNPAQFSKYVFDARLQLTGYGSGTHTGTAAYTLRVDSSGNVIETPIGAGAIDGSGTDNYLAKWSDADTITDSIIYDDSTSVGIGTNSPGALLDLQSPAGGQSTLLKIKSTNSSAEPMLQFDNNINTLGKIGGVNGGGLMFRTLNNVEAMRITSDGKIGIGYTSPPGRLSVAGGSSAGDGNTLYVNSAAYNGNLLNAAHSPHRINLLVGKAETGGANLFTYVKLINSGTETAGGVFTDHYSRAYGEIDKDITSLTNFVAGYRTWAPPTGPNTLTHHYGINIGALSVGANGTVTNNYGIYLNPGTTATNNFGVYQAGSSVDNYFQGNVAIGTQSTPVDQLSVRGTSAGSITIGGSASTAGDEFGALKFYQHVAGQGVGAKITATKGSNWVSGNLLFHTGENNVTSPNMIITSTGRVGIGTTSPSGHLHVIDSGNLSAGGIYIENTGTTSATLGLENTEGTTRLFTNNGVTGLRNIRSGFSDYTISIGVYGVKVKEGSGGINSHASAILDLDSTTQGVLFPRMTEGDRTSIASPATGLIVYQTDGDEGLYIYKSTGWLQII